MGDIMKNFLVSLLPDFLYRAVVLVKLLYAFPAWWGFATTSDKQCIEAFVRRGVRLGLYSDSDVTPLDSCSLTFINSYS